MLFSLLTVFGTSGVDAMPSGWVAIFPHCVTFKRMKPLKISALQFRNTSTLPSLKNFSCSSMNTQTHHHPFRFLGGKNKSSINKHNQTVPFLAVKVTIPVSSPSTASAILELLPSNLFLSATSPIETTLTTKLWPCDPGVNSFTLTSAKRVFQFSWRNRRHELEIEI